VKSEISLDSGLVLVMQESSYLPAFAWSLSVAGWYSQCIW